MTHTPDTANSGKATLTRSLKASAIGVAAVTFSLSFYGLQDFAQKSMRLPGAMSWLVPVGLDGLTLVAIAATFMLRHAAWHVRAYAWSVFAVAAGLSMAGNHQHATDAALNAAGTVGFTVAPVMLALAAHLVVVTWRNVEREQMPERAATASPARKRPAADTATGDTTPDTPRASRVTRPNTLRSIPGGHDIREQARALAADGLTVPQIAARLGKSERTIFRYLAGSDTPASGDTAEPADDDTEPAANDR